jgi:hypothetical protein
VKKEHKNHHQASQPIIQPSRQTAIDLKQQRDRFGQTHDVSV